MVTDLIPVVTILDIIKIKRENEQIKTTNKACHVISCRTDGESTFFYDNHKHKVKRGDVLYIPYGANYTQSSISEELICFHIEAYNKLPQKLQIFYNEDTDCICKLFWDAYNEWYKKDVGYECRCMSILYRILSVCDINNHGENGNTVQKALDCLKSDMYKPDFSIADICKKIGISQTYLNQICHNEFGCSTISYIQNKKIEKAQFLLECGGYTNDEIAQTCGFASTKYFYTTFNKITGMTTKQYRAGRIEK